MTLIQNACRVAETDTYLVSTTEDDLMSHTLPDGLTLSIAGGLSFARRDGDFIKLSYSDRYDEWCLTTDDSLPWVADRLLIPMDHASTTWRPIKEQDQGMLESLAIHTDPIVARVASHWLATKYHQIP